MTRHRLRRALGALFGGAVLAAWGAAAVALAAAIDVPAEATFEAGAESVAVASVTLDAPGYVVIHEGASTAPGAVLGASTLMTPGAYGDVEVALDREIEDGEVLWAVLYTENNLNSTFDAGIDMSVTDTESGNPAVDGLVAFPMRMAQAPAVRIDVAGADAREGDRGVTVPAVTLDDPGYVVLYQGSESVFSSAILGRSAFLEAGAHEDVRIAASRALRGGETVWAVVHAEAGGDTTFRGEVDLPVTDDGNGNPALRGLVAFPVRVAAVPTQTDLPVVPDALLDAVPDDAPDEAGAPAAAMSLDPVIVVALSGVTSITVPVMTIEADGYLVVTAGSADGPADAVIGVSHLLRAGDLADVAVEVDRRLEGGEFVWLTVVRESTGDTTFDGLDVEAQDGPAVRVQVSSLAPGPAGTGGAGPLDAPPPSTATGLMALLAAVGVLLGGLAAGRALTRSG
ncbi:MAG: hypothetical protein WD058_05965 [Dehalococcoidia bacterium]